MKSNCRKEGSNFYSEDVSTASPTNATATEPVSFKRKKVGDTNQKSFRRKLDDES